MIWSFDVVAGLGLERRRHLRHERDAVAAVLDGDVDEHLRAEVLDRPDLRAQRAVADAQRLGSEADRERALGLGQRLLGRAPPAPASAPPSFSGRSSPTRDEVHRRRADEAGHEQVHRLVVERARRVALLQHAVLEHRDAVAHRHRLDLVVRDVDGRHAQAVLQLDDLGARLHAQLRVEVGERLVHQVDRRLADDRAPHRHALALAAREGLRLAVEIRARGRARAPPRARARCAPPSAPSAA